MNKLNKTIIKNVNGSETYMRIPSFINYGKFYIEIEQINQTVTEDNNLQINFWFGYNSIPQYPSYKLAYQFNTNKTYFQFDIERLESNANWNQIALQNISPSNIWNIGWMIDFDNLNVQLYCNGSVVGSAYQLSSYTNISKALRLSYYANNASNKIYTFYAKLKFFPSECSYKIPTGYKTLSQYFYDYMGSNTSYLYGYK